MKASSARVGLTKASAMNVYRPEQTSFRSLLQGETVDMKLPWFSSEAAKLWSLAKQPPAIYGAALTTATAGWMGPWTDGVITVRKPVAQLREFAKCYEDNGGDGQPRALQLQISWGGTLEKARFAISGDAPRLRRTASRSCGDRMSSMTSP